MTPPGKGGIAVIVLKGDGAERVLSRVFRSGLIGNMAAEATAREDPAAKGTGSVLASFAKTVPVSSVEPNAQARDGRRQTTAEPVPLPVPLQLGRLVDSSGQTIDETVVARGDGAIEINIHGGPLVTRRALDELARAGAEIVSGTDAVGHTSFQLSHPDWHNPAIGLEMLQALGMAQSELAVAAVSSQWSGGLSAMASRLLRQLDEGTDGARAGLPDAVEAAAACRTAAGQYPRMRRLLEPATIVLAGPPNAGKSTLANHLIGRQASIVHEMAGTTRDYVSEMAIVDGVPVRIVDTAGLWATPPHAAAGACGQAGTVPADIAASHGAIDQAAVGTARECLSRADVVLLLGAAVEDSALAALDPSRVIRVWSKCDQSPEPAGSFDVAISAHDDTGLIELNQLIVQRLGLAGFDPTLPAVFTARQVALLEEAGNALGSAQLVQAMISLRRLLRDQG